MRIGLSIQPAGAIGPQLPGVAAASAASVVAAVCNLSIPAVVAASSHASAVAATANLGIPATVAAASAASVVSATAAHASGTWLPSSIAGLETDYDPTVGVTIVSGKVSALGDQGGSGDVSRVLAQANASLRPVISAADPDYGGKDVLQFTAADQRLFSAAFVTVPATGPLTVYLVCDAPSTDGMFWSNSKEFPSSSLLYHAMYTNDNSGSGGPAHSLAMYQNFASGPTSIVTTSMSAAAFTSPRVACLVFNGASAAGYVNDPANSYVGGDLSPDEPLIGVSLGSWQLGAFGAVGRIARCLVYSGAHNLTNRTAAINGLKALYGL